jgi:putative DNA primase/helicase
MTEEPPNSASMKTWALAYAKDGFRVLPIHTLRNNVCSCEGKSKGCKPGKHPVGALVRRGALDATTDPNMITDWWSKMPDANIGIATGEESELVVLDVDGVHGEALLAELERAHGPIPETMVVQTGNGRHAWLSYPRDVFKVPSVARDHLDVRGDGGYVVGPPSKHANGHTYAFAGNTRCLAECPLWVVRYANGTLDGETSQPAIAGDSSAGNRAKRREPATAPAVTATLTPHTEETETTIRSALACIPAHDRTVWRNVGMGLHSTGWENAFLIWDDWSRTSPEKYNEAAQRKTWESFDRPYSGSRITLGTIFHLAKHHGWLGQTRSSDAPGDDLRTDLGNTKRFVKRYGENIRYVYEWKKWIVWDDNYWKVDEDGAVIRLAKETVESIYTTALKLGDDPRRTELLKHAIKSQAEPRIFAIERMARSDAAVALSVRRLDANPWLIGVQNGVVDLTTGHFRPGQREDYIAKSVGAIFDPNAQCVAWNAFLGTVTGHDANLKAYLQRMVGYAMTGSVREEVLFVLYGTGNNGKSTFREVVHALLGEYAIAADASLLIERK